MIRRPTRLDGLPFVTVLALCTALLLWASHGKSGSLLGAEGDPSSVEPGGLLLTLATGDVPPGTPWGDRTMNELLERVFDPPGRTVVTSEALDPADEDAAAGARAPSEPPDRRRVSLPGPNGERLAEGFLAAGKADGRWTFRHPSGARRAEGLFRGGVPEGRWLAWSEDGASSAELTYRGGAPDGSRVEWWPNGQKRLEGLYVNGQRHGLWRTWHQNGVLRSEGEYRRGLREGAWLEWHPHGQPSIISSYANGRRQGQWRAWHANGTLESEGLFADGKREGPWTFFEPNGLRDRRSGMYVAGVRVRD